MGIILPPYCSINVSTGGLRGDNRLLNQIQGELDRVRRAVLEQFPEQWTNQTSEIRIIWETTHNTCSCCILEGGKTKRVVTFDPQDLTKVLIRQWCYLALQGEQDLKEELVEVIAAVAVGLQFENLFTHEQGPIKHAFSLIMASGDSDFQQKIWKIWVQAMQQLRLNDTKQTFVNRTITLGSGDPAVRACLVRIWRHVGFNCLPEVYSAPAA